MIKSKFRFACLDLSFNNQSFLETLSFWMQTAVIGKNHLLNEKIFGKDFHHNLQFHSHLKTLIDFSQFKILIIFLFIKDLVLSKLLFKVQQNIPMIKKTH